MISFDQLRTERCGFVVLTATDTIIELGRHIEILVTCSVMRFVERTVVSDDVGDIAVLAVAEFDVVVARLRVGRRGGGAGRG